MDKKDFFYPPKMLQEWIEPYQEHLGIEAKSVQSYISFWLSDSPRLPDYAKRAFDAINSLAVRDPWQFCAPPDTVEGLRPRDFWHDALGLEGIVAKTTWNNQNDDDRKLSDVTRAAIEERLDDYRVRMRSACTRQEWDARLLAGIKQEEEPDYLGYDRNVGGAWYSSEWVSESTRHFFTREECLQEIVAKMPPDDARRVAARAHALSRVEMTLINRLTCEQTYSVEITREDEEWAAGWWARVGEDLPDVPVPFLGEHFVNVGKYEVTARSLVDGVPQSRSLEYKQESDFVWTGRQYKSKNGRITAVKRDGAWVEPTEDDLLLIDLGFVWEVEPLEDKENLWRAFLDSSLLEGFAHVGGKLTKRDMQPGEEELLRAEFERRWVEVIEPSHQRKIAARARALEEARQKAEKDAVKSAVSRRLQELLEEPTHHSEVKRKLRLVETIRQETEPQ